MDGQECDEFGGKDQLAKGGVQGKDLVNDVDFID